MPEVPPVIKMVLEFIFIVLSSLNLDRRCVMLEVRDRVPGNREISQRATQRRVLLAIRAGAPQHIALTAIIQVARHHKKIIGEAVEVTKSCFIDLISGLTV